MTLRGTPARLGAYAGILAVAFGAAFAIGAAVGPVSSQAAPTTSDGSDIHRPGASDAAPTATLPGLSVSQDGYTLVPSAVTLPVGRRVPFRFAVTGPSGDPVRSYRTEHEKELHLIVVHRDLSGFQHVHPTRSADGTWTVPLNVDRAGTYRVFADFTPAALGSGLTLGADVAVGGTYRPTPLPASATTTTVDGYDVALAGSAAAGHESELAFTVSREGSDLADLQPYLGAFGHLVSLRAGDLAYLHTHPSDEASAGERGGPQVRFSTEFPTPGTYRLFLDFKHAGKVRTAAFTVTVGTTGSPAEAAPSPGRARAPHDEGGGHGHP